MLPMLKQLLLSGWGTALRKCTVVSVMVFNLAKIGYRQGKNQPKSAAAKPAANGTTGTTRGGKEGRGRGVRRGRNAGRPKPKTAEELDLEMVDYFDANVQNTTTAATDGSAPANRVAQTAANGEDLGGMDDIS